MQSGMNN